MSLQKPRIEWQGKSPRSTQFDDIYYSPENGLQESQYVFLENNKLSQRWENELKPEGQFVIAETGFGTGLNFLAAWLLWNQRAQKQGKLHFVSFERFPLSLEELKNAYENFPQLKSLTEKLLTNYPKRITGLHHIELESDLKLSLYFGEALEGLQELNPYRLTVDAWFFDGFSPKNNPELWSEDLFNACSTFNKKGSTFSTFSSAGHIKRKLETSGFSCEKVSGFANKREMLRGVFQKDKNPLPKLLPYSEKPWFIKTEKSEKPKRAAVIGAGLAGCWTARKLAERGIETYIFDKAEKIANDASGNPRGATYFKLEPNQTNQLSESFQFYLNAYMYSVRELQKYFPDNESVWKQTGLIQVPSKKKQLEIFEQLSERNPFEEIVKPLHDKKAKEISSLPDISKALYFPDGGSASPRAICETLVEHKNINFFGKQEVAELNFDENKNSWSLANIQKEIFKNFDAIVLANSHAATQLTQSEKLPLHKVRGQSTQIKTSKISEKLSKVICTSGYLTPGTNGVHTLGSTFDPRSSSIEIREEDNHTNLDFLKKHLPGFYASLGEINIIRGRAGLRCQTPDMLPILGNLCIEETFTKNYQNIAKGQLKKNYPTTSYYQGLYVNLGHASRGLISTPYCAEILASEICGEAPACETSLEEALSPVRFYLRAVRKNSI
jgi:tRNA 5-methylaminomethyl-2-thiouridine biosynthesis bifunctional protein